MEKILRFANALFILVLMGILSGSYYIQFFKHEMPCALCIFQRFAMCGIGLGCFLNLRNGLAPKHYGLSLLFALFGASVSLRHIAFHACPGFPPFGMPVFGLSLYTWAFLTFIFSIFATALLLLLQPKEPLPPSKFNLFEWTISLLLLLFLLSNSYTTYLECFWGPC